MTTPLKTNTRGHRFSWLRVTRDGAILVFAISAGAYEIVLGGGRASVLTFLGGLLLSPVVMRVDQARRSGATE
jgi:hypothetical protein